MNDVGAKINASNLSEKENNNSKDIIDYWGCNFTPKSSIVKTCLWVLNGLNLTLTALHPEVALALAVSLSISGLTLFFLSPTKQLPKEDIYLIELRSNHMGIFHLSQNVANLD